MNGHVDDNNRALLPVSVRPAADSDGTSIDAWIDTAFDGHFVFPNSLVEGLGLESLVETEAVLADGKRVTLETFVAYMEWFGKLIPVQVVANEGQFPLLGTALLNGRRLVIDYTEQTLELS